MYQRSLEKTPFQWKQFLYQITIIAVPVALQNLLTTTGSMVDTIMLASLGQQTVGAVGLCAQFSSLFFSCYWGFVSGGMLYFTQYWGAKDSRGITRSYGMTLSFMLVVTAVFTLLALGAPEFIMGIYTDKTEIQRIGVQYLKLVGFAYPLQILATAISALLRSIEQVRIPLYGGIASVIANCFFNYLFIFGKFGLPQMGVAGAALGTILAAFVNLCVLLIFVRKEKIPFVLEFSGHFKWNLASVKSYIKKCFPILCQELAFGIANMVIAIVLGHQSEDAIAAVAVFRTLEGFVIAFFTGFSNASTVLVGKEVGAGNHELAFQRAKRVVYLCSTLVATVCIVLLAIHTPMLHAMGLSGESYQLGFGMLLIYSFAALFRTGNWVHIDTFRTAGDTTFGSVLEISFTYLLMLPCLCLSNYVFHAPFLIVFACCYIDEPIRYLIFQIYLYSGKWIRPVSEAGRATLEAFQKEHAPRAKTK